VPPDAELLPRFVATRDPGAFRALVERHGPLVLAWPAASSMKRVRTMSFKPLF